MTWYKALFLFNGKIKTFFDESDSSEPGKEEEEENTDHSFQESFDMILNKLLSDLNKRITVYIEFLSRFSFLTNQCSLNAEKITTAASSLQKMYATGIEESSFVVECLHLKGLLTQDKLDNANAEETALSQLNSFIISKNLQDLYPNISICLKVYLCTPATNCAVKDHFPHCQESKII